MKRIVCSVLAVFMGIFLFACGQSVATWQDQYDLGVRYLSEGNYEEAIIAFTAAIEIDPKQTHAYIGLANAYIGIGDVERAKKILGDGLNEAVDTEAIEAQIDELSGNLNQPQNSQIIDSVDQTVGILPDQFSGSSHFNEFEDLSTEHQKLVLDILTNCTNSTFELVQKMLSSDDFLSMTPEGHKVRTLVNGYKIEFTNVGPPAVEIRPESGVGFAVNALIGDWSGGSFMIGSCDNWNWNGEYEGSSFTDYGDGCYSTGDAKGIMVDCLLHGAQQYVTFQSDINSTCEFTEVFENGTLLQREYTSWESRTGEIISFEAGPHKITGKFSCGKNHWSAGDDYLWD